jgi:hypothetical protein
MHAKFGRAFPARLPNGGVDMKIYIPLILAILAFSGCIEPSEDYAKTTTTVKATSTTLEMPSTPTTTLPIKQDISDIFEDSKKIEPPQMPPLDI